MKNINPTELASWDRLKSLSVDAKKRRVKSLFQSDPNRFERYSITWGDILFDYSKNNIDDDTLSTLLSLAEESGLKEAISMLRTASSATARRAY